jgi:hypothetical protein
MLSLIEVKCPHCGAQGQIMLPPLGAIIVGPCPECQGMVAIFCGRVLPLDSEIMQKGEQDAKKEHLLKTIVTFIHERVDRLFGDKPEEVDPLVKSSSSSGSPEDETDDDDDDDAMERITLFGNAPTAPITQEEMESFLNVDLKLIDDQEYFKAVFK